MEERWSVLCYALAGSSDDYVTFSKSKNLSSILVVKELLL